MMNKELLFDMDGTIADLYGYPDWLQKIRNYDTEPYEKAKFMYQNKELFLQLVAGLRRLGYKVKIVSALPKAESTTEEYNSRVARAKKLWLIKHQFPCDEIHICPYEQNKADYSSPAAEISILIDDNPEIRNDFLKECKSQQARVIDAAGNLLKELANLYRAEY